MYTTVTLNPCIDRTAWISGFRLGEFNAVTKTNVDISGKGINVSVLMAQLGIETRALLFNFKNDPDVVLSFLREKNVPYTSIDVEGSLRVNFKLFDDVTRVMTECNEKGWPITEEDEKKAYDAIISELDRTDAIILTGSVPPTVSPDIYYNIIVEAKKRGVYTVLDADKELFKRGILAKPDFIKPNRSELVRLVGRELNTLGEIVGAAREIVESGIPLVCVSMGSDGAILTDGKKVVYSKGAPIEVKGVQGAGDSLVTGIMMAREKDLPLAEMLKYGVAVANGSLMLEGTKLCTRENFEFLLPRIDVSEL